MAETLALLPGWGLGPAALEPLAAALSAAMPAAEIQLTPLPMGAELEQVLNALDSRIPDGAWLAGWSLGGMLATALAARRGACCPGLITVASNPCFIAREGWPAAMATGTFEGFAGRCAADPAGTLKRFALLCAQGSPAARQLAKRLTPETIAFADPGGLALLAAMDNRPTLAALTVPQLHLFASADAFVPAQAGQALAQIAPKARVEVLEGSHALLLESPQPVAARIHRFIEGVTHG